MCRQAAGSRPLLYRLQPTADCLAATLVFRLVLGGALSFDMLGLESPIAGHRSLDHGLGPVFEGVRNELFPDIVDLEAFPIMTDDELKRRFGSG